MTDISIIIVNWNVRDLLDACLASIMRADLPDAEIIVVDCASADDSLTMLREKYPSVKVIALDENVGFTRGNNIGIQQAKGRYLFLLNPDTEIISNAIFQLFDYMEKHPEVGIIGPHTLNTDGSHQSTRRRFPTPLTAIFESTWLQPYAPKSIIDSYYATDIPNTAIAAVDWVQGSAMMVRREVYEQTGGFDEGFFMYSEELDWCKRARDTGWKVVYHGEAKITHHGGKSSEQASASKHIYYHTSKLRYFRKHHGFFVYMTLRILLLTLFGWQMILESAKAFIGHKRDMRRERVKTYWQVLRSGLKAQL